MTMVHDILKQMPGLGQPQRKFLATLFITILVLRGRVNFRNLSRYCDDAERTIARQFREPFDWPDFHQRPPRRPSQAPLMALPSPILRCMSRPRSTALRLPQGHTGGAAAPRAREESRRGVAAEFPIRSAECRAMSNVTCPCNGRACVICAAL